MAEIRRAQVYRVSYFGDDLGHQGYEFFFSKREAVQASKKYLRELRIGKVSGHSGMESFDRPKDQIGWLRLLNSVGRHNDNG